ncbi:hypothetical protein KP509_1Z025400 [Ceratopteris richardii]|nr:hypothetical protein KP509_1Z025400 [Ceratopteris richardii]
MDSTHSRDEGGGGGGGGGTKSSDSLSSSKTGGHENAVHMGNNGVHIKSSSSPSAEAASIIFTREALLPVLFSMLFLGLIVFGFLHVGGPVSNRLTQTLKAIGFTSGIWKPTSTTSLQVQELHERLMQTLKVSTKRLEDRVDGLKAEMEAEIARQKQETEEIRREIRSRGMLEKEMKNADRDGFLDVSVSSILERPDYALGTGGGRVVGHSAAYKPSSSSSFKWFDRIHGFLARSGALHPLAPMILQPSFNQPGQCLPLAGSDVYVEVALRTAIFPDQVTLSHVSKSIAYDISSAPKDFQIYGLAPPLSTSKPATWIFLGEFAYDVHKGPAAQTFLLGEAAKRTLISTIKLHVLSNYGSPAHTCIYRIQVHGKEPT